jgi:Rhodanese-like domain
MKINIYIVCLLISILVNTVCSATDPNYLSPETVEGAVTIDTSTAKKLFDEGAFFIDVRKTSDFEAGRIPGALHL